MSYLFSHSYCKTRLKATVMSFCHVSVMAPGDLFWPQLLQEVGRQVSQWVCSILPGFLHRPFVCRLEPAVLSPGLEQLGESREERGSREEAKDMPRTNTLHTPFCLLSALIIWNRRHAYVDWLDQGHKGKRDVGVYIASHNKRLPKG